MALAGAFSEDVSSSSTCYQSISGLSHNSSIELESHERPGGVRAGGAPGTDQGLGFTLSHAGLGGPLSIVL